MRFVRYGAAGRETPGILDRQGDVRDISSVVSDLAGPNLSMEILSLHPEEFPIVGKADSMRLGPCMSQVGKLICFGFNSRAHVEEMGLALPEEPSYFLKASSAINGPTDNILYPKIGQKVDWEGEIAVIVGQRGKYITEQDALDYVLGYACFNDISDRYWQFTRNPAGQHTKGKSFDTFATLGPWLVTKDEVGEVERLTIRVSINGVTRQNFLASDYILGVRQLVSVLSQFFTLYPGDVIAMGSGPGNAGAWNDAYLQIGDIVEVAIDKLGIQRQVVVAE